MGLFTIRKAEAMSYGLFLKTEYKSVKRRHGNLYDILVNFLPKWQPLKKTGPDG